MVSDTIQSYFYFHLKKTLLILTCVFFFIFLFTQNVYSQRTKAFKKKQDTSAVFVSKISIGVSANFQDNIGFWLETTKGILQKYVAPTLDCDVNMSFRITNDIYIGTALFFQYQAQAVNQSSSPIIGNGANSINIFNLMPLLTLTYNSSRGFSEPLGWILTAGGGAAVSIIQDYFATNIYTAIGGGGFIETGLDVKFLSNFRTSLIGGFKFALMKTATNIDGSDVKILNIKSESVGFSPNFYSIYFKIGFVIIAR